MKTSYLKSLLGTCCLLLFCRAAEEFNGPQLFMAKPLLSFQRGIAVQRQDPHGFVAVGFRFDAAVATTVLNVKKIVFWVIEVRTARGSRERQDNNGRTLLRTRSVVNIRNTSAMTAARVLKTRQQKRQSSDTDKLRNIRPAVTLAPLSDGSFIRWR